jgi:hypothetical protein
VSNVYSCVWLAQVAGWAARRLFSIQPAPWEETLFLARWQTQVPGVGDTYNVSTSMLKGLAIQHFQRQSGGDEDESFWIYLPAAQIMNTATTASNDQDDDEARTMTQLLEERTSQSFDTLFEKKAGWLLEELQPYLDAIVDATAISQTDLLAQYTLIETKDVEGFPVKLYHKR